MSNEKIYFMKRLVNFAIGWFIVGAIVMIFIPLNIWYAVIGGIWVVGAYIIQKKAKKYL